MKSKELQEANEIIESPKKAEEFLDALSNKQPMVYKVVKKFEEFPMPILASIIGRMIRIIDLLDQKLLELRYKYNEFRKIILRLYNNIKRTHMAKKMTTKLEKIVNVVNSTKKGIKNINDAYDDVAPEAIELIKNVKELYDIAKPGLEKATEFTKEKVIPKTKEMASKATKKTKEIARDTKVKAKEIAKTTTEKTKEFAKTVSEKTSNLVDVNGDGKIDEKDVQLILDAIYDKSVNGIAKVSKPVKEICDEYKKRFKDDKKAAKQICVSDITKCTTSGFLTGFGGLITLPVTLPANITSVLYVQMRMIASVAYLAGLDLESDATQTFVYATLAGVSITDVLKNAGIKFGQKLATSMIKKIPGKTLTKINQKVGFRFITKFGETGIINLGKAVPVVGAAIGGTVDFIETKIIADRSLKIFFEGDVDAISNDKESVIDAEFQSI